MSPWVAATGDRRDFGPIAPFFGIEEHDLELHGCILPRLAFATQTGGRVDLHEGGWYLIPRGPGDAAARGRAMKLQVVFEPSEEGGYTVYVPALPGCISEGDTREEALSNIQEAIELYLEPIEDDTAAHPEADVLEIAV